MTQIINNKILFLAKSSAKGNALGLVETTTQSCQVTLVLKAIPKYWSPLSTLWKGKDQVTWCQLLLKGCQPPQGLIIERSPIFKKQVAI